MRTLGDIRLKKRVLEKAGYGAFHAQPDFYQWTTPTDNLEHRRIVLCSDAWDWMTSSDINLYVSPIITHKEKKEHICQG